MPSGIPHEATTESKQRVRDLSCAGIPKHLIAKILKMDEETLNNNYADELSTAHPEAVERISKTVIMQAENGDPKAQALYLKTQGAKYGWVEKQVIEQADTKEMQELQSKIAALEDKYSKDY